MMTPQQKVDLRQLLASETAAASIERAIVAVKAWRLRHATPEDRRILERLPIVAQASYKHADQADAAMAAQRLRCIGSIAQSVQAEIAADLIRERRGMPA